MSAVAEQRSAAFATEFNERYIAWTNQLQTGSVGQGQAAVEDTLRRWRQYNAELLAQTDSVLSNNNQLTSLADLISQVNEQRSMLTKLQGEASTRTDQANVPRIINSPYTNILGLRRVFRPSTWNWILAMSVIFGFLALFALVFLVYRVVVTGELVVPKLIMGTQR